MKSRAPRWLALVGILLATASAQAAPRPLEVDDYFSLMYAGSPVVSPDGKWVAYTVSRKDLEEDSRETRIWMRPLDGGEPLPMTARGSSAWSPRWTPDGSKLSFVAYSAESGSSQVHTLDLRGGERVQLTDLPRGVESYEWSPQGDRLALVLRDPAPEKTGPGPWVIDRMTFKADYTGYLDRRRGHIYVYHLESRKLTQLTGGDYEDYSQAWSPDGRRIAFVSNRTEEPDANTNSDIWLVDADKPYDQQEPARVTTNPGSDSSPLWHPDGKRIAYLMTSTDRTDVPDSYLQTKVAIIAVGEKEPRLLTTEELDRKAWNPQFSPDGSQIHVMLEDNGEVQLASVAVADGKLSRPVTGEVRVEEIAVGPDGRVVIGMSQPRLPYELFVLDEVSEKAAPRPLTQVNDEWMKTISLSPVEELRFPTVDGTEIQTFVYKPRDFDPKRKYPAILWLHGGQESQYDYGFHFRAQLFASKGYVVVMPNVRGSGGRGLEFGLALNKAYGTKDVEDVLAATDHVIAKGYVDPDKLGVGGWSSGGTLTNMVIGQTERFAGAISGASVGWYTSTYGHDPYQVWWHTELGAPWKNRELWDKISPFMLVENITTPTLFIGGEKDWNQPIIHSEQMYQAMKRLGREASLVVYPDAHHGIRRPVYQQDLLNRFVAWFDKHVKGDAP